jgi:hypothetical protein
MIFSWLDTSEVDAFATSLANEFIQRVPPESLVSGARGGAARFREAAATMLTRAGNFASGRPLNVFKRARLANSVKWKLHAAGYEKDIVDQLTLDVAKRVSTTKYDRARSTGHG